MNVIIDRDWYNCSKCICILYIFINYFYDKYRVTLYSISLFDIFVCGLVLVIVIC